MTPRIPSRPAYTDSSPKSSGLYNRVRIGEAAITMICPAAVPPTRTLTLRAKRFLGRRRRAVSLSLFAATEDTEGHRTGHGLLGLQGVDDFFLLALGQIGVHRQAHDPPGYRLGHREITLNGTVGGKGRLLVQR